MVSRFRPVVPGCAGHTQILADQLTLFQPGGTDCAHLITTGTPGFSDLPTALVCKCTYSAFATLVAMASHACSSISPAGSTSFTPLSGAGLCEAVIINPITPEICQDHKNY